MGAVDETAGGPQPGTPHPDDYVDATPVAPPSPAPDDYVDVTPIRNQGPAVDVKAYAKQNLADSKPSPDDLVTPDGVPPPQPGTPEQAKDFTHDFLAGLEMSSAGLGIRGKLPDYVLPENADMAARFLRGAGMFVGDIPAAVVGMIGGAAVGGLAGGAAGASGGVTAIPGALTGAGAGLIAGGYGLPPAIREHYVRRLTQDGTSWRDFWSDLSASAWAGVKGAATGVGAVATGGLAAGAAAGLGTLGAAATGLTAEVAAMTGIGSALEGRVPTLNDLTDNAVFILGFHGLANAVKVGANGAKGVAVKLGDVWAKTGLKPGDVAEQARQDPVLHQQLVSEDAKLPEKLASLEQPRGPNAPLIKNSSPELQDAKIPPQLAEEHPVLSSEFKPDMKAKTIAPPSETAGPPPAEPPPSVVASSEGGGPPPVDKADILARIGEKSTTKWWDAGELRRQLLDRLNPVVQVMDALTGEKELPAEEDVHSLLSRGRDVSRRVELMWNHGPVDWETGKPTGTRGMAEILADHPAGEARGLQAYMNAKRAIEIEGKGFESGFGPKLLEKSQRYVDENAHKYEKPAKEVVQFQNDMVKYGEDAGLVKPGTAEKLATEHPNYIPWNRIDPDRESGSGTGKGTSPIKKLKGSELLNTDSFEQIFKNTTNWVSRANLNVAARVFLDKIDEKEMTEDLAPKVKWDTKMIPADEHQRIADTDKSVDFISVPPRVEANMMFAMRDGVPDVRDVGEPVASAFKSDPWNADALLKMAAIPTHVLREGAVHLNAPFALKHFIRDITNAPLYTKNGFIPVLDNILGALHFQMNKIGVPSDMMRDFIQSGSYKGHVSSILDTLTSDPWTMSKQSGYLDAQTNMVRTPMDLFTLYSKALRNLMDVAANAAPYREFEKAVQGGKSLEAAARDSRSITPDPSIVPAMSSVRAIGSLNAFWSYRLKGIDMMVQAMRDNPGEFLKRGLINIGLPTAYLWNQNKDQDWYKNASDTDRDLNWLVADPLSKDRYGNAIIHKVAKPFEPGILFGSLLERSLNAMHDKDPGAMERAFHGFGGAVFEGAVPIPFTNALKPVIEQVFNRGLLSKVPLIPQRMKDASPNQQYYDYTSNTARALGRVLQLVPGMDHPGSLASPIVLENYVRSWAGGTGIQALHLADSLLAGARKVLPPVNAGLNALSIENHTAPEAAPADGAFGSSFNLRWPSARQAVSNFYDNMDEVSRYKEDFRLMKQRGDTRGISAYANTWESQEATMKFSDAQKAISQLESYKSAIYRNDDLNAQDKRNLLDRTEVLITKIATDTNKKFYDYKAAFNQRRAGQ